MKLKLCLGHIVINAWLGFGFSCTVLQSQEKNCHWPSLPSLCPELTVGYSQEKKKKKTTHKIQSLLTTILGKKKEKKMIVLKL